jgi:murein L,D-transpeptidase YafK
MKWLRIQRFKYRPFVLALLFVIRMPGLWADFRYEQMKYPRVQEAYQLCREPLMAHLRAVGLKLEGVELYLRAFKMEMTFEVWARNESSTPFVLVEKYPICRTSGELGPKRRSGDKQIPEGFYRIIQFNPESKYLLSLGINFPNAADRVRSGRNNPGDSIFIHGACVTNGCIPLTNEWIRRLYILCVEARNHGQTDIPVHIFPGRLDSVLYPSLCSQYRSKPDALALWADLKLAYDCFFKQRKPPNVHFLPDGRHQIEWER